MTQTSDIIKQAQTQMKLAALSMVTMVYHGTGTPTKEIIKQAKELEKYINS